MYPFDSSEWLQKCDLRNWGYNGGIDRGYFTWGKQSITDSGHVTDPYVLLLSDRVGDGVLRRIICGIPDFKSYRYQESTVCGALTIENALKSPSTYSLATRVIPSKHS